MKMEIMIRFVLLYYVTNLFLSVSKKVHFTKW